MGIKSPMKGEHGFPKRREGRPQDIYLSAHVTAERLGIRCEGSAARDRRVSEIDISP